MCQMGFLCLPPELRTGVILHLQPRFVYRLMRTNKRVYEQCMCQQYWERVAFHLTFRCRVSDVKVAYDLYDMALLRMGYKRSMDTFIEAVRQDIRTSPSTHYMDSSSTRPPMDADAPLSQLIPYGLDLYEKYIYLPGVENMRLVARGLILDTERTEYQVQDMLDGTHHNVFVSQRGVLPVTDGSYITEDRRKHRASARFLQALEDETSLDLDAKQRLLASAVQLVKDIFEKRETYDHTTRVTTRREDPIPNYEWVSIMRPPWEADDWLV